MGLFPSPRKFTLLFNNIVGLIANFLGLSFALRLSSFAFAPALRLRTAGLEKRALRYVPYNLQSATDNRQRGREIPLSNPPLLSHIPSLLA